jgi:hypothetical protein
VVEVEEAVKKWGEGRLVEVEMVLEKGGGEDAWCRRMLVEVEEDGGERGRGGWCRGRLMEV